MNDKPIGEIAEIIFNMDPSRADNAKQKPLSTYQQIERNNEARRKIEEYRERQLMEDGELLGLNFSNAGSFRELTKNQRTAIDKQKDKYNFGSSK